MCVMRGKFNAKAQRCKAAKGVFKASQENLFSSWLALKCTLCGFALTPPRMHKPMN